jgi:ribonuclease HII
MLQLYYTEDLIEAGCDEVGRGCLAGPVVAAAVILPKSYFHPLLNDSKKVTPTHRTLLAQEIKQIAIAWAIGEASHEEIEVLNISNASYLAMHRAIQQLAQQPQLLLIDGKYFKAYSTIPHQCIVDGDAKFSAIAAASILAKTYRDDYMQKLAAQFPGYGWETNVGYPTPTHQQAIQQRGITPYHRRTYGPIKQVLT